MREDTIEKVKPGHPSELIQRVPGAVVMQTNGEGHTTGIRQPIGTAPVYLFLEDGVPTRSTGFFNHNALYEVNLPQADAVEVIRGPGTALQGSDAIGGVVNALTKAPSAKPTAEVPGRSRRGHRVTGGLRLDLLSYDYDNHLSVVQTGSKRRPADDTRYYTHLSPSLGATYAFTPAFNGFANYKHSFRAPSESQLFRQGADTNTVNLRPVKVDSYEVGLRGPDKGPLSWEVSAYHMIKRNDILTLRDGTNNTSTNNGRTHHDGVEAAVGWRFLPEWRLGASGGLSRHKYEKWFTRSGNTNVSYAGNEIAAAPNVVANLVLGWAPAAVEGLTLEAEWSHLGDYNMDEANTAEYGGHDLFNLRGAYALNDRYEVFARVMNVLDRRWASQASISSNERVYAPGLPRTVYAGLTARF